MGGLPGGVQRSTRSGGGVILNAIHEIDYIRWMLGEVAAVACLAGKHTHLEIETEDTAAILFRFASSAIGEVHMDYLQRAYSRTCHIMRHFLDCLAGDAYPEQNIWGAAMVLRIALAAQRAAQNGRSVSISAENRKEGIKCYNAC